MHRTVIALILLALSAHAVVAQTIFEEGLNANLSGISVTHNPNYFRGSLNFDPILPPNRTTLFRGRAESGDFCNFDLVATMFQEFAELPGLLIELLPLIIAGIGIHFLCATFPEQCSLMKDIKNYANLVLRFQRASCNEVVESAMYGGVEASNSALGECFRDAAPGESSQAVWRRCREDRGGFIPLPNGGRGTEVDVIAIILETAGVPPEDAARIQGYTGSFTIFSQGNVFSTAKTAPTESAITYYAARKEEFAETVAELVSDAVGGNQPSAEQLAGVSVPGTPLPVAAIDSIAGERNATMRAYKSQALAAQLALARSKWDLTEDLHKLEKAIQASEITPDQAKVAHLALANFKHEINRLEELKKIVDEHYRPAVEGLLEARANQLLEATIASAQVQPTQNSASRYPDGQTSFGYSQ